MLVVYDICFAIALAAVIAAVLLPRRRAEGGPRGGGFLFLLLLCFPLIWAGGLWIGPLGVPLAGSPLLGFAAVALFLLLFALAFAVPSGPARDREGVIPENAGREAALATALSFGLFFWMLSLAAGAAIVAAYSGR